MLEITADDQLYMTIVGRGDRKFLYDNQGAVVLNICNRALNFGGEYQVGRRDYFLINNIFSFLTNQRQIFEGDTDKVPLFTVKNKWSLGGPRMVVNFANFEEEPIELQVRGKLLNSKGKIVLNSEPIARFESGVPEAIADEQNKLGTVSTMTVAPLGESPLIGVVDHLHWFLPLCVISRCCHGCDHLCVPTRHIQQGLELEA